MATFSPTLNTQIQPIQPIQQPPSVAGGLANALSGVVSGINRAVINQNRRAEALAASGYTGGGGGGPTRKEQRDEEIFGALIRGFDAAAQAREAGDLERALEIERNATMQAISLGAVPSDVAVITELSTGKDIKDVGQSPEELLHKQILESDEYQTEYLILKANPANAEKSEEELSDLAIRSIARKSTTEATLEGLKDATALEWRETGANTVINHINEWTKTNIDSIRVMELEGSTQDKQAIVVNAKLELERFERKLLDYRPADLEDADWKPVKDRLDSINQSIGVIEDFVMNGESNLVDAMNAEATINLINGLDQYYQENPDSLTPTQYNIIRTALSNDEGLWKVLNQSTNLNAIQDFMTGFDAWDRARVEENTRAVAVDGVAPGDPELTGGVFNPSSYEDSSGNVDATVNFRRAEDAFKRAQGFDPKGLAADELNRETWTSEILHGLSNLHRMAADHGNWVNSGNYRKVFTPKFFKALDSIKDVDPEKYQLIVKAVKETLDVNKAAIESVLTQRDNEFLRYNPDTRRMELDIEAIKASDDISGQQKKLLEAMINRGMTPEEALDKMKAIGKLTDSKSNNSILLEVHNTISDKELVNRYRSLDAIGAIQEAHKETLNNPFLSEEDKAIIEQVNREDGLDISVASNPITTPITGATPVPEGATAIAPNTSPAPVPNPVLAEPRTGEAASAASVVPQARPEASETAVTQDFNVDSLATDLDTALEDVQSGALPIPDESGPTTEDPQVINMVTASESPDAETPTEAPVDPGPGLTGDPAITGIEFTPTPIEAPANIPALPSQSEFAAAWRNRIVNTGGAVLKEEDAHPWTKDNNGGENLEYMMTNQFAKAVELFGEDIPLNDVLPRKNTNRAKPGHPEYRPGSLHFDGLAVDINLEGMDNEKRIRLFNSLLEAGFRGFGFGNGILHADLGTARHWTYGVSSWGGVAISDLANAISSGAKAGGLVLPPQVRKDTAFVGEVERVAGELGIPNEWLWRVMQQESGLDPHKFNNAGSGALGLIQFMPNTLAGMGLTKQDILGTDAAGQMKFVEQYMKNSGLHNIENPTIGDVYMAILWPKAMGKPDDYVLYSNGDGKLYSQNAGLDINKDGKVTKAEATAKMLQNSGNGVPYGGGKPRRGGGGSGTHEAATNNLLFSSVPFRPSDPSLQFNPDFVTGSGIGGGFTPAFTGGVEIRGDDGISLTVPTYEAAKETVSNTDEQALELGKTWIANMINSNVEPQDMVKVAGNVAQDLSLSVEELVALIQVMLSEQENE